MQFVDAMFSYVPRQVRVHFDSVDGWICVLVHCGVAGRVRV